MTPSSSDHSKTQYTPFEETQHKKRENIAFSFNRDLVITEADVTLKALFGEDLTHHPLTRLLKHAEDTSFFIHIFDAPKLFPEREFEIRLKDNQTALYVFVFRPEYRDETVVEIKVVAFPKPNNADGPKELLDEASFNRQANFIFSEKKKEKKPLSLMVLFAHVFTDLKTPHASFSNETLDVVLSALQAILPSSASACLRTEDYIMILLPDFSKELSLQIKEDLIQEVNRLLAQRDESSFFIRLQAGASEMAESDPGIHTMLERAIAAAKEDK